MPENETPFPWFMLITSIFGDLVGWFNVFMVLVTAGAWVAISATIWNIVEAIINGLHYFWYTAVSSSGIDPKLKKSIGKKLIVNKIATTLFGWIPVIGDIIPKLTISTLVFYFTMKAMSKLPIAKLV